MDEAEGEQVWRGVGGAAGRHDEGVFRRELATEVDTALGSASPRVGVHDGKASTRAISPCATTCPVESGGPQCPSLRTLFLK